MSHTPLLMRLKIRLKIDYKNNILLESIDKIEDALDLLSLAYI
jgi:hypothetical protein